MLRQACSSWQTWMLSSSCHGRPMTTSQLHFHRRLFAPLFPQGSLSKPLLTNNKKTTAPIILPYSQSLPSVGHEWCTRCQIRAHAFQKPLRTARSSNKDDACAALPTGMICPPARRYFRQQRNFMLSVATIVFVMPAVVNGTSSTEG